MLNRQAAALLLLLVLVDHHAMLRVAIGPLIGIVSDTFLVVLAWGWIFLMGAAIGLSLLRPRWAIPVVVLLIPLSTVLLSLSYVPFLMSIVPNAMRPYSLLLVNIAALVLLVFWLRHPEQSQLLPPRKRRNGTEAGALGSAD